MKTKWLILALVIGLPCVLFLLALRPVPMATPDNWVEVTGQVSDIFEGTSSDVNIDLVDDPNHYYINRGLEQGLDIGDLRKRLMHQTITLSYVKHWTPLDPANRGRHVARLTIGGQNIFNAIY